MQRPPTTTFKIVFALKKLNMKKCLKKTRKVSKNAEFHADFKYVEKVVKMNTKKVISKKKLMNMSKSSLLGMFMKFVWLITFLCSFF
jgi:hypothetical protein